VHLGNLAQRLRARRSNPAAPGTYRLASSIRLPWSFGLGALLILAVTTAVLVGRTGEPTIKVPAAVLDYQERIARDGAQSLRRSLNEGVSDVDELARVLSADRTPSASDLPGQLQEFARAHKRYSALVALDRRGRAVARVGTPPPLGETATWPLPRARSMRELPRGVGQEPVIEQLSPLTPPRSRVQAVVGYYNPTFMRFPLEVSRPGNAWVVNARGQVVGTRVGHARLTLLPRQALRQAAARGYTVSGAESVGGTIDTQEVVGYSPVAGGGPAGKLGWTVVATRDIGSFALPQTDARRQGLMAGVALGVLVLLIFGWLYIVVVAPVLRLQREAERLAYGDLSKSVEVVRYDEIGLIARALERMRINSIRKRVQSRRTGERNPWPPKRVEGGLFGQPNGGSHRRPTRKR
jgi:HAMP domain-containing protein